MALIKADLAEIRASSGEVKLRWRSVSTEFRKRSYIAQIWGPSDSGKTREALTAPGPIAFLHNNDKVDGVLEEAAKSRKIEEIPFRSGFLGTVDEVQDLATNELAMVLAHIKDAYSWARSIIIDHETALWALFQLAQLGTLDRAEMDKASSRKGQLIYTKINANWLNMIMDVREINSKGGKVNLILVSKSKNERVQTVGDKGQAISVETSKIIAACQKSTFAVSDLVLHTWVGDQNSYNITIDKPWNNGPMRGLTIPSMPLSEIVALITKTDAKEWE
jgi:sporulation protein YlmC with PRC-barrel domain